MKKAFFATVAALALAVAIAAPIKPAKADVEVLIINGAAQVGAVGAQVNGAITLAGSSAGKAVADSTAAAIVNSDVAETTVDITADGVCGCNDVGVGIANVNLQAGFVGLQANFAGAGAFGKLGAGATANAIALVNSASKTTSVTVTAGN